MTSSRGASPAPSSLGSSSRVPTEGRRTVTSRRIAVFTAAHRVELRSDPERALAPGEALVRIKACGLCTMEQRLWTGAQTDYPIAAGHETAGVVEAVHPG